MTYPSIPEQIPSQSPANARVALLDRVPPMDERGFQRWLDAYVEAWRTYDPTAIGRLFSEDVEYRYHPWDEPVRGRDALVADWLSDPDEPDTWTAEYRPWLVADRDGVAVGVSRYLAADRESVEREYHNVFLCRFDGEGRCREFTELFLKRPDPAEPS